METYDSHMLTDFYARFPQRLQQVRDVLKRPLTYAEKILYLHADDVQQCAGLKRGADYALFRPDRVCMQDATAQMAILQFINAGCTRTAVPTTIHCDHLVKACHGAAADLTSACSENAEVYGFLQSAAQRYGIGFWPAGAGIIHQVMLENYAFPGGMMVGTDSHTPNAGGLGMFAVGVGGADAVDVMIGQPWELKLPRIIGVQLTGHLKGWATPKDVILRLAEILTTKGATNAVVEYFGEGTRSLSATGKATICNMGAEIGATTSVFPYDDQMYCYLTATGRTGLASFLQSIAADLQADAEVQADPEHHYDQLIRIDLSTLRPAVNGPFTPDLRHELAALGHDATQSAWPIPVDVCLIGSCTNSSYEDLARAASVLREGLSAGRQLKSRLIVCPGSELVRLTAERDGILGLFRQAGVIVMSNACGPCIGQWQRLNADGTEADKSRPNTIVTTFNRNFAKRADGNPHTCAFIASPEVAVGFAFTGRLDQHPSLMPEWQGFEPHGPQLPDSGYLLDEAARVAPSRHISPDEAVRIAVSPESERLQLLQPFPAWDGKDFLHLPLLIKVKGKCTTDHISMAGPWLRYRGHLANISRNLLLGALNAFTEHTGLTADPVSGEECPVWQAAQHARDAFGGSVIVAEDNYGEGSSREHAAMEPRLLGVKAVLAKSFARIHETNLKKQGVLALTFTRPDDYQLVKPGCRITVHAAGITPGAPVKVEIEAADGTVSTIMANHTYNDLQISWFKAGSALQYVANTRRA